MKRDLYWHFINEREDGRLQLGNWDSRIVAVGEKVKYAKTSGYRRRGVMMCQQGMHASHRITDALYYSFGYRTITQVYLYGPVTHSQDKCVAHTRSIVRALTAAQTWKVIENWVAKLILKCNKITTCLSENDIATLRSGVVLFVTNGHDCGKHVNVLAEALHTKSGYNIVEGARSIVALWSDSFRWAAADALLRDMVLAKFKETEDAAVRD